jgi:hypothetical protein
VTKGKGAPLLVKGKKSFNVWQMRRALEEAAYYPTSGEYGTEGGVDPTSVPVNDAAPWVQTGWGLISPARQYKVIEQTLAHMKIRGKATRSKPQGACDFMTANMAARRGYWEQVAIAGQGFGQAGDPYIYC